MMDKKGFTLVELAVVIAVMSVLVGVLVVSYGAMRRESVVNNIVFYTRDFQSALQRFMSIHGRLPNDLSDGQFVPDYFFDPEKTDGFRFVEYKKSDSRCSDKPTITLNVGDAVIPKVLEKKLRLCNYSSNSVVIQLIP